MTRRVAFFAAVFSVAAMVPVTAVSASAEEPFRPVARYFPVQITGPAGFTSPNNGVPWGLDRLDQRNTTRDQRYEYNQTGAGVTVYVADTGVQANHPDLLGRVVPGWSYRSDAQALAEYRTYGLDLCDDTYPLGSSSYVRQFTPAVDFDYRVGAYPNGDDGTTDNELHGTHVASTIVGALTGVAKDVTVVPVRVLDSCGQGTLLTIANGLQWVLDRHQPGQKAIINLSLGFSTQIDEIDSLIQQMIDEGIVVVAAAGNYNPFDMRNPVYPDSCGISPAGSDPRVITVAASESEDGEAYFSFRGDCVDLFAPGQTIIGAWAYAKLAPSGTPSTSSFLGISGTSMAAPHVSGALARYLETAATMGSGASVSDGAMTWLKTEATCNAISYFFPNATLPPNSPNRLLAVDAPTSAPCSPTSPVAVAGTESATVSWTEPAAFNGEVPTYTATATPGGASCTTTTLSCTITGLAGGTQHTVSVVATNSAGSSTAVTATVTPTVVPAMSNLVLTPGNATISAQWSSPTTTATTFTAIASPGGQQCVTTSTSCVLSGLTNNQFYTVTVTGTNYVGSTSLSSNATPNGAPLVPATIRTSSGLGRVTLRWDLITDSLNPTYTASSRDGRYSCVSIGSSCVVRNLPNGKLRTLYLKTSTPAGGTSVGETAVKVWAGFKVRRTELKKSSRILLTSIVIPVSTGRRTYSTSSACRISAGRLVTPRRATTCYLALQVGKTQTAPAMSVRLKLAIR